jgi:hypothetical protein
MFHHGVYFVLRACAGDDHTKPDPYRYPFHINDLFILSIQDKTNCAWHC